MEKLIELLNEYNKEITNGEIGWKKWKYDEEFGNILYGDYNGGTFSEMYCISKRYGFIERLVENDKIDIYEAGIDELPAMFGYDYESVECKSDRLIMILSIQDNSIEYLCSILK